MSKKIPQSVKGSGAIAMGHYAIFCSGIGLALSICQKLRQRDETRGIPAYGQITYKGKKYWYCRYGFVNDPDIYAEPSGSLKH